MSHLLTLRLWGSSFAAIDSKERCKECNLALVRCFDDCCIHESWKQLSREHESFVWSRGYLQKTSASCSFCTFLLRLLSNDPRLKRSQESDEDQICLRNSRELGVAYERNPEGTRVREYHYYWPALHNYEPDQVYNDLPEYVHLLPYYGGSRTTKEPAAFMLRKLSPYTDFDLMKRWVRFCCEQHQNSRLSNRCKTGPWPEAISKLIQFVDTRALCLVQHGEPCEYVALSYVWGKSTTPFMLLDSTSEKLHQPGALSGKEMDVPQTYLDAIHVCQKLGYRYLWIDAICIKQDSPDEKKDQVLLMDTIYRGAILTIVNDAPSANSGLAGVSQPRNSTDTASNIDSIYRPKPESQVGIGPALPSYGDAIRKSTWETRGWTLQEKLFSTRLLVFTSKQAYFHCRHMTCAEDSIQEPQGTVTLPPSAGHVTSEPVAAPSITIHVSERNDASFGTSSERAVLAAYSGDANFWGPEAFKSALANYVARQLSFEQDTIAAFAGALRQFGSAGHLYGHPLAFFAYVINWRISGFGARRRRGFPSWSWAGWKADDREGKELARPGESWIEFNGNPQHKGVSQIIGNAIEWFVYDEQREDWRVLQVSKRAKLDRPLAYELNGHPTSHGCVQGSGLPALQPFDSVDRSHVLRFWTSTCQVTLDRSHEHLSGLITLVGLSGEEDREIKSPDAQGEYTAGSYAKDIVEITIPSWWTPLTTHSGNLVMELIVVAQERCVRRGIEKEELSLMLVEPRQGDVVSRVNMAARSLDIGRWRALNPVWKCINLA